MLLVDALGGEEAIAMVVALDLVIGLEVAIASSVPIPCLVGVPVEEVVAAAFFDFCLHEKLTSLVCKNVQINKLESIHNNIPFGGGVASRSASLSFYGSLHVFRRWPVAPHLLHTCFLPVPPSVWFLYLLVLGRPALLFNLGGII